MIKETAFRVHTFSFGMILRGEKLNNIPSMISVNNIVRSKINIGSTSFVGTCFCESPLSTIGIV